MSGTMMMLLGSGSSPPLWTPANMTTQLWYDADDAGTITVGSNGVSEWRDKSGNARHRAQTTPANRPVRVADALGARDAIQWPSSANSLGFDATASITITNIFIVVRYASGIETSFISGPPGLVTRDSSAVIQAPTSLGSAFETQVSGTTVATNGGAAVAVASKSLPMPLQVIELIMPSAVAGTWWFGSDAARAGQGFHGLLTEIVAVNGITAGERTNLNNYLINKWGVV